MHSVVTDFSNQADIEIVEVAFEEALALGRDIETRRQYDAIVTAGSNAALLRAALDFPIINIKVTGYDLLVALTKARRISNEIGVGIYHEKIKELEAVKDLLQVNVVQQTYETFADARECFQRLREEGLKVIVGSSLVVEMAEACGLTGILVYSPESIRQAIEDALQIAQFSILASSRYESLGAVVSHLHEAVLAVDTEQRITTINPPMERLLSPIGVPLLGRKLTELAPELSLTEVLRNQEREVDTVIMFAGRSFLVTKTALRELGVITGAILVLYDAQTIQRADVVVRSQRKQKGLSAKYSFDQISGLSPALAHARKVAERYARSNSTVLLTGESGTGKEMFAHSIHNLSSRGKGPFVALNCASFPESLLESELFGYEEGAFTGSRKGGKPGLFEAAHTGTVFLDEIGDMPVSLQTRLLRVLQEREVVRLGSVQPIPVDVRVIAATHGDLTGLIQNGKFRADLFYRLNILRVTLPPLRERKEDIGMLGLKLLHTSLRRQGSSLPADQLLAPMLPTLLTYGWPGNVRELENVMERFAVYLTAVARIEDVDYNEFMFETPELRPSPETRSVAEIQAEIDLPPPRLNIDAVRDALARTRGNKQLAAELLGISRTTLWRMLKDVKPE
jgi:propionate catabolism operon transcriptional regulator